MDSYWEHVLVGVLNLPLFQFSLVVGDKIGGSLSAELKVKETTWIHVGKPSEPLVGERRIPNLLLAKPYSVCMEIRIRPVRKHDNKLPL